MALFKRACIVAILLVGYTLVYMIVRAIPNVRPDRATGPGVLLSQIVSPWYWGVLIAVGVIAIWYTSRR